MRCVKIESLLMAMDDDGGTSLSIVFDFDFDVVVVPILGKGAPFEVEDVSI